jgi:hypothetical protein
VHKLHRAAAIAQHDELHVLLVANGFDKAADTNLLADLGSKSGNLDAW